MLAPRKRPLPCLATLLLVLLLFFYHRDADAIRLKWATAPESHPDGIPANKTLGFGALVVVSKEGSQRRHSLLQAANVTDIDLTIPTQPSWSEEDIEAFRNGEEKGVHKGSILAWLGHHAALRWFLDSGLETALILEDDVDWDIHLRTLQVPLAASAVRSLLPPPKALSPFAPFATNEGHVQYWGDHSSWDLLYLGHCGDYFSELTKEGLVPADKEFDLRDTPHALYNDSSLPVKDDLHPFTKVLFDALKLGDHQRVLHRSKFPLCSFGYAVTRPAAERLLNTLAPKLRPKGARAFDVALLHACLKGSRRLSHDSTKDPKLHPNTALQQEYTNPGLRCWTVNPELFHHMPGQSLIAQIGDSPGQSSGIPPVDLAGQAQIRERQETSNIGCGFWDGQFSFDDDNMKQLRFLQENVGRKGLCLKESRDRL